MSSEFMVDLHCHILPGIDDGAETVEEALALARCAVSNGITHLLATPHVHAERYDNDAASVEAVYRRFSQALAEHGIPLQLYMAGEVRIGSELLLMIPEGRIPFMGTWDGRQVMLLEFPHSHIPPGSDKLVKWLLARDILPMIAHPERNKAAMRDVTVLKPFRDLGCLFQVTAMSVSGDFGEPAQRLAEWLLVNQWVTVLASDAHNLQYRPPNLEPGRAQAAAWIGEEAAWQLVRDNPARLLGLTPAAGSAASC